MIQGVGLLTGNVRGLKQIVDKRKRILKEAEGVHVKNLREMRDAQQMSNRNRMCQRAAGEHVCRCVGQCCLCLHPCEALLSLPME